MSIEFVEPERPAAAAPAASDGPAGSPTAFDGPAAGARGRSAWGGRTLAVIAAVAGVLVLVGTRLTLYTVVRTAAIVDFDDTTYRISRIPVDAFGRATPARVTAETGLALSDFTPTASVPDGIPYGPWWIGLGVALLVVAGWALLRPRASGPGAVIATAGGVLLGSLGAAWLAARTVAGTSVPQIRFAASPAPGLWLLLAAGVLALLAGLSAATRPPLRRLLPRARPRSRRHDRRDPGPAAA